MSIISPICGISKKRNKSKRIGEITPQLSMKVFAKTEQILKSKGIKSASKKQFDTAYNEAIKFYGYTPQYFKKIMKEIGTEDFNDDFYF